MVTYQRSNADPIVPGTHGRRGFSRFVLGSVAQSVARPAPTPVLLARARSPAS
jgi:nucleotide-binding universal stress UspA family protein